MSTNDYLGYGLYAIAYGTSILAFLMTRLDWLRMLFVLSSGCYALYYFIFPAEPLWLDVLSEGAFVLVNLAMLGYVYWIRRRTIFSDQEQHLYDRCFSTLDTHEFKKVLALGTWQIFEPPEQIIQREKNCDYLYCLFSGSVEIRTEVEPPVTRQAGSVLGELSYRLETVAKADVFVRDTSVLLALPQGALRKLCGSNERIKAAVDSLLSAQMASKLSGTVEQ